MPDAGVTLVKPLDCAGGVTGVTGGSVGSVGGGGLVVSPLLLPPPPHAETTNKQMIKTDRRSRRCVPFTITSPQATPTFGEGARAKCSLERGGGIAQGGHSNSERGMVDCRMIDIKVPMRNSSWSGIGTVVVPSGPKRCMSKWLPRLLTST